MNFKDQYHHPKWQEKRLEVFAAMKQLHGYLMCDRCQSTDKQLQVHHKRYIKNRKIWEYSVDEFEVLCDGCHDIAHAEKEALYQLIATIPTEYIQDIIELLSSWTTALNVMRKYKSGEFRK